MPCPGGAQSGTPRLQGDSGSTAEKEFVEAALTIALLDGRTIPGTCPVGRRVSGLAEWTGRGGKRVEESGARRHPPR